MLGSAISWHISCGVYMAASVDICHLDYSRIPRILCHLLQDGHNLVFKPIPLHLFLI